MRYVSEKFVKKTTTHILCSTTYPTNRAVCEITWKKHSKARQPTDGSIIWRMRIACWILNATHILRICNTYCFSSTNMFARPRLSVTSHVHYVSCYTLIVPFVFSPPPLFFFALPFYCHLHTIRLTRTVFRLLLLRLGCWLCFY